MSRTEAGSRTASQDPIPRGEPGPSPALARIPPAQVAAAREIFAALGRARTVLVMSEPLPDGDALGAELCVEAIARHAFARAGRADGEVLLVNERGCPRRYAFLPGSARVRTLEEVPADLVADVAVVVDGGAERIGRGQALFDRAKTRIYMDHHKMGSQVRYDHALADPRASSTTQLLWPFFADPELGVPLTREVAAAIYLGLIYDTGSFQYPLTRPLSHEIAARCMETGLDTAEVHEKALLVQELPELRLLGRVLADMGRAGPRGEIVHGTVSAALLDACGLVSDDTTKVIQTLCFIDGIDAAVLFREVLDARATEAAGRPVPARPERWKLSFRARGRVDVAAVARELDPTGGGHERAAGCNLDGPLDAAKAKALRAVEARLRA